MTKDIQGDCSKPGSKGVCRFQKFLLAIESNLTAYIAGGCLIFIMIETTIDVFGRYLFRKPISGTVEITEMLMVVVVFLGTSYTQKVGLHIKMGFVLSRLQGRRLAALRTWNALLGVLAILSLAVSSILDAVAAYNRSETTPGPLFMTAWPFHFVMFIGVAMLVIRLLTELGSGVSDLTKKEEEGS